MLLLVCCSAYLLLVQKRRNFEVSRWLCSAAKACGFCQLLDNSFIPEKFNMKLALAIKHTLAGKRMSQMAVSPRSCAELRKRGPGELVHCQIAMMKERCSAKSGAFPSTLSWVLSLRAKNLFHEHAMACVSMDLEHTGAALKLYLLALERNSWVFCFRPKCLVPAIIWESSGLRS